MTQLYTIKSILLIVGSILLLLSLYTLFRSIKRDKVIALNLLFSCILVSLVIDFKLEEYESVAANFYGTYKLKSYHNSANCKLAIFEDRNYFVFTESDTLERGTWDISLSNELPLLLLEDEIFGLGEFELIKEK